MQNLPKLSTLNTTHPRACKRDPEKTGRSEQRLRILTSVSSPGSLPVLSAQSREEGRILCCPLFSKSCWLSILSFPGIANAFFFVSFCVLKTWLGNCQVGGPQNMARSVGFNPFADRYGWTELWVALHLGLVSDLRGIV